ncbi:hypothetical protein EJ03DRAFT_325592 [Teratosphaeria nubilosa]|uniref:Uncharacterized protein n=1 Tax=Teratosphaeria nubilosa TaxID=161662 RepID=A0A6G1LGK6_9PEZI|nr:hypothetical protein EJ03DRAFT_325592 [Teratosphaeria nubilosa]
MAHLSASGKSQEVSSSHSSQSRPTSSTASSGESCVRSGASRSPPKDREYNARHRSEGSYAIRKWFGEKGKWLYTEHVFPDGTSVVVKGEKPDDMMGSALHCEDRSAFKENGGGGGGGRFEETDGSRQGSVGSRAGSAGSLGSEEMARDDSGLSFTSKSKSPETLERRPEPRKTSRCSSRTPLQQHALNYGTFTTDLEAGRYPHRPLDRRPLGQTIGKVPWFEIVLAIAWLMFIGMFVKTMFLRKEMYGCYWGCSGSLIRKV